MPSATQTAPASRTSLWAGRILTALVVSFLLFDCTIKLMKLAPAVEGTGRLGYQVSLVPVIGLILLVCTALYVTPSTVILGGIFLTGYLGPVAHRRATAVPRILPDLFRCAALGRTLFARTPAAGIVSAAKSGQLTVLT